MLALVVLLGAFAAVLTLSGVLNILYPPFGGNRDRDTTGRVLSVLLALAKCVAAALLILFAYEVFMVNQQLQQFLHAYSTYTTP